ncbi:MAG: GIY-YIG nuclease family protein [Elusimicrobia bacterium]|nr:GIY-YIG nuclease family protein [Elusimicrobiota bacterium]
MKTDGWSVYIARCADDSLYTGVAKDVEARLAAHNAGRGAAYTRTRRPVSLAWREDGLTRSAALTREARIKALRRAAKQAFLRAAGVLAAALLLVAGRAGAVPSFDKENPVVFSSAAPQAFAGDYPALRMYFIRSSSGVAVGSALSADGISWTEEGGARLSTATLPSVLASSITACSLLALSAGGFRMLYSIVSTTGAFRIHSATSADGLAWANETGVRVEGATTFLGSPRLVKLTSGDWRLYYVADANGGNNLADRQIFTSLSTNEGLTWSAGSVAVSTLAYEVGAAKLTDGTVRLFFTEPVSGSTSATVIASARSTNSGGASFSAESGARVSTSAAAGTLAFPVPARSTDSYRWRLYYDFAGPNVVSTANVHGALTGAPAPASVSPASVLRTAAAATLTISGETFSTPAPTVQIAQAGQTLAGSGVTRTDDQTITASFSVFAIPTGLWDLTVTNADGRATTLSNALLVDFPGGDLTLTNNLLRPREGIPTLISVTIYNPGHVRVRIYARDGRLVRTLLDAEQAQGTIGLSWDGRDAAGGTVASGVYLVRVVAPRLDVKGKVVVIR